MKAFRFSLQSVRVLRERREQVAQKHYADALRARDAAADELQDANQALAQAWHTASHRLAAGLGAAEWRAVHAWSEALERRQQARARDLQAANGAVAAASRDLLSAARERQAMDSLHDKCRRAYDRDAQRAEQKRLDEMGLLTKLTISPLTRAPWPEGRATRGPAASTAALAGRAVPCAPGAEGS